MIDISKHDEGDTMCQVPTPKPSLRSTSYYCSLFEGWKMEAETVKQAHERFTVNLGVGVVLPGVVGRTQALKHDRQASYH